MPPEEVFHEWSRSSSSLDGPIKKERGHFCPRSTRGFRTGRTKISALLHAAFGSWRKFLEPKSASIFFHAVPFFFTAFSLNLVSTLGDEAPSHHPLPVASLTRTKPVDFESEILPFLKESCLACHNQTKAKAD